MKRTRTLTRLITGLRIGNTDLELHATETGESQLTVRVKGYRPSMGPVARVILGAEGFPAQELTVKGADAAGGTVTYALRTDLGDPPASAYTDELQERYFGNK